MPPVSLLIKPASSNCNLRCSYCFYHSIAESRMTESYGIMNAETLEPLVKSALEYADNICTFAFQGGEPTLAGLDFFKNLVSLVKIYNFKKVKINYAIQTNGLVIDSEWASFLSEHKFLVGISLDGPKDIHDAARFDSRNVGSFNRVMNAISLFNKHHVEYNILSVVNSYTARHINQVYSFFKKNNFDYLQFIPCLDPLDETPGGHQYSLTPERYALFLKRLFDEWYKDILQGKKISIRYFDNLIGMLKGYPPESCGMSGVCTAYFVVEADGSTYPCDFYTIDEWSMGNITNMSFKELKASKNAVRFTATSVHVSEECKGCKFLSICRGGCRRDREPFEDGKPVHNRFCQSYREFFEYAGERLTILARRF